jgi:thioredoxin-related protein
MKAWRILLVAIVAVTFFAAGCGEKTDDEAKTEKAPAETEVAEVHEGVDWYDYETGMAKAAEEGKFVVIDFWTTWCHWCKVLDDKTYSQEIVQQRLADSFIAIKVNAESKEAQGTSTDAPTGANLARKYGVNSYPTTWFVDPTGEPISPLPGFMEAPKFARVLDYVSTSAYKSQGFQEYMAAGDEG